MKKILILLILTCTLYAQQLPQLHILEKPVLLESEIAGVRDANGKFCAAIQVISDMEGFRYDSNNGIVRVDDQPGQDMVFMSSSERLFKIFHSGFEPLRIILSAEGILLKEKSVWQIKVSGIDPDAIMPVVILVEPTTARVKIDTTVYTVQEKYQLEKGEHILHITQPGFKSVRDTILIDKEHIFFQYDLEELPDALVRLHSIPDSAVVYLDSLRIGVTPINTFYKPGIYQIKITRDWYQTLIDTIEIMHPVTDQTFELSPNFGTLKVTSTPNTHIFVYLNDSKKKLQTPCLFEQLRPGEYIIKSQTPYYRTREQKVTIAAGEKQQIELKTIENDALLTIKSHPDAQVAINGQAADTLNNIRLEPSVYEITATMPKAKSITKHVTLRRKDKKTLEIFPVMYTATVKVTTIPYASRVVLKGKDGEFFESTGAQVFKDIPIGSYTIRVSADSFKTYSENISLISQQQIKRDVQLARLSGAGWYFLVTKNWVFANYRLLLMGLAMVIVVYILLRIYIWLYWFIESFNSSIKRSKYSSKYYKVPLTFPFRIIWKIIAGIFYLLWRFVLFFYKLVFRKNINPRLFNTLSKSPTVTNVSDNKNQNLVTKPTPRVNLKLYFDLKINEELPLEYQCNQIHISIVDRNEFTVYEFLLPVKDNKTQHVFEHALQTNRQYYVRVLYERDSKEINRARTQLFIPAANDITTFRFTYDSNFKGMIFIPAGTYTMGSNYGNNDEKPEHKIRLSAFYIDKFLVSNELFALFLNEYNSERVKSGKYMDNDLFNQRDIQIQVRNEKWQPLTGFENFPVIGVSWYGANEYAEFYGKSLPTEAQWEVAARGGDKSGNYTFSGSNSLNDVGWYMGNSKGIRAIGQKQHNELGIYDMSGNVYEWCRDYYDPEYYTSRLQDNPLCRNGIAHVLRGGCWKGNENSCRTSYRISKRPGTTDNIFGFRCVSQA